MSCRLLLFLPVHGVSSLDLSSFDFLLHSKSEYHYFLLDRINFSKFQTFLFSQLQSLAYQASAEDKNSFLTSTEYFLEQSH